MKKTIITLLSILFITAGYAQVKPAAVAIAVRNGKFSINKTDVTPDWQVLNPVKVLGLPSRSKDGINKTHTYNDHGIVLFEAMEENAPSGRMSEFQVYMSEPVEKNTIMPDSYFKGKFIIEKLTLTTETTISQLRAALPGYRESDSYMDHNFRLSKDGIYLYFLYDADEQRLIKVSIGKDKRKYDD